MNRKERRRLEKDLGITKHKQGMNFNAKIKSIREGIQSGKEKSIAAKENRRRQENEGADEKASADISSLATTLMLRDELSWYEATEAAKKEISEINAQETESE